MLKRRIFLDRGLDCQQYKENYLKRRVAVRLRASGAKDYLDYLRYLRNDPDEYTKLLNELTINVTQFFRDKDVYAKIRDEVIPSIIAAKRKLSSRSLRVWSAGCASGEEPYSLAMLVDRALGEEAASWNIRVLGSDLDDGSLKVAREAAYTEVDMLEGLIRQDYFETKQTPDGTVYRVNDRIRRKVKIEKLNLLADAELRHFDLVACRNVLIYFGREVQTRIIESLAAHLLKDGYLVLGKSETLGHEASQWFAPAFPRERIYRLSGPQVDVRPPRAAGGTDE